MLEPGQTPEIDSLDSQKLVQDALDLINIDSPTGREQEVGELYA